MSGPVGLAWHDRYLGRGFVPRRASWSRYALALKSFDDAGFFRQGLAPFVAPQASEDELATVHAPSYLAFLRDLDARGEGLVDGRQTPAYTGMLFRASVAVGGTVLATRLVTAGRVAHAFNPAGGLHHAHPDRASGFCLLNDIAVAVRALQREGVRRIAVVDIDAHHGDGTQAIFWNEDVLVVSVHEHGGRFFPGTGTADETGAGVGEGYTMNLPLRRGDGDAVFLAAVDVALERVRGHRPEVLLVQFGTDGHVDDPFSHLRLSDAAYVSAAERAHALAHEVCGGALVLLGGGGYSPETVARVWTGAIGSVGGFRMLVRDG
ncbi:MAG TPA: acetoin utilization protein AcuC [Candidatus Limnocylindria bacterium]|nr:acetoin utilization protein AcuC [Candidatus Limnocylindria bacterium]